MPIIQSVERALQILDLFNEQATELKITDISKLMGLSKSTLHSLLKTLQLHGYIDQNPENGKYRLGMKLVERGHFVVGSIDIRQKAKGWLTGRPPIWGSWTGVKGSISRRLKASWPPSPIHASAAACRCTPPPSARC